MLSQMLVMVLILLATNQMLYFSSIRYMGRQGRFGGAGRQGCTAPSHLSRLRLHSLFPVFTSHLQAAKRWAGCDPPRLSKMRETEAQSVSMTCQGHPISWRTDAHGVEMLEARLWA